MTEVRADAVNRARELRRAFDQTFAEVPLPVTQDVTNLLGIRVGGDPFAIRLGEVAGLFADRKIVPLPSPVPELLGVAGFRSGLIPIYSLRGFLGYPPASEIHTFRTVMRISAPIFNTFSRIVEHWALANSVPCSPSRRSICNNT